MVFLKKYAFDFDLKHKMNNFFTIKIHFLYNNLQKRIENFSKCFSFK